MDDKKRPALSASVTPGITAILQGLTTGGQPVGELGKQASNVNPSVGDLSAPAVDSQLPLTGTGPNPVANGLPQIDPQQLQLILQALLGQAYANPPSPAKLNE
jgi:hypothetical protein